MRAPVGILLLKERSEVKRGLLALRGADSECAVFHHPTVALHLSVTAGSAAHMQAARNSASLAVLDELQRSAAAGLLLHMAAGPTTTDLHAAVHDSKRARRCALLAHWARSKSLEWVAT